MSRSNARRPPASRRFVCRRGSSRSAAAGSSRSSAGSAEPLGVSTKTLLIPAPPSAQGHVFAILPGKNVPLRRGRRRYQQRFRSEEHTSELQSHLNLVCRLLLEKKKRTKI